MLDMTQICYIASVVALGLAGVSWGAIRLLRDYSSPPPPRHELKRVLHENGVAFAKVFAVLLFGWLLQTATYIFLSRHGG